MDKSDIKAGITERADGCCLQQTDVALEDGILVESSEAFEDESGGCCCCDTTGKRHKERSSEEYTKLMNRLNRIEGQIGGVKKMLERGAYCPDILVQVMAINSALNGFSKELLSNHVKTCVVDDIKDGREEAVDELVELLRKMMK